MPSSEIVHRYTFSFREAIAALLLDEQCDADSYEVRVVNNVLVLDIINPVIREKETAHEAEVGVPAREEGSAADDDGDADAEVQSADPPPQAESTAEPEKVAEDTAPKIEKLKGGPLAARAGIICNEKAFAIFMDVTTAQQAADELRAACGIESRAELDHNEAAAKEFKRIDRDYRAWLQAEDGQ